MHKIIVTHQTILPKVSLVKEQNLFTGHVFFLALERQLDLLHQRFHHVLQANVIMHYQMYLLPATNY